MPNDRPDDATEPSPPRQTEAVQEVASVASAMTEDAHRESLADTLAEIRAELGPATDEETAWARTVLRQ